MSQQKNAHYFLPRAFEKKREREGIECEKSWEKEGFEIKLKPIDNKTWAHHILPEECSPSPATYVWEETRERRIEGEKNLARDIYGSKVRMNGNIIGRDRGIECEKSEAWQWIEFFFYSQNIKCSQFPAS